MRWLLLLAMLPATALADDWQKRQSEFYEKSTAERQKLGLDQSAAKSKYPTPEVTFSMAGSPGGSAARCVAVCPGKTAKVALNGKLPPNSLVLVESDDFEVVQEGQTARGWEGTVKAKADAPPRMVRLTATSPVSAIRVSQGGLEIGCQHTLTFDVAGETMGMKLAFPCGQQRTPATGEWRRGGKVLGSYTYEVQRGDGSLNLSRQTSQEEAMAQGQGMIDLMSSKEMKDIDARFNVEMEKVTACSKGPMEKMQACMEAVQPRIEKLNKEREKLMLDSQKKGSLAFGCATLDVQARGGSLKGEAQQCSGRANDERVPVTGRYASP